MLSGTNEDRDGGRVEEPSKESGGLGFEGLEPVVLLALPVGGPAPWR